VTLQNTFNQTFSNGLHAPSART